MTANAVTRFRGAALAHENDQIGSFAVIDQRVTSPVAERVLDVDHRLTVRRRDAPIGQVVAKVGCDQHKLRIDNHSWKSWFVFGKREGDKQECQREEQSPSGHGNLRERRAMVARGWESFAGELVRLHQVAGVGFDHQPDLAAGGKLQRVAGG